MNRESDILLKKWLQGEITAEEEARLRLLAKADPFLADALDGYLQHADRDPRPALGRLRNELAPGTRKNRFRLVWLPRLAAAAVLVGLIGWGINQWLPAEREALVQAPLKEEKVADEEALPDRPIVQEPTVQGSPATDKEVATRTAPPASPLPPAKLKEKPEADAEAEPEEALAAEKREDITSLEAPKERTSPTAVAPPSPQRLPQSSGDSFLLAEEGVAETDDRQGYAASERQAAQAKRMITADGLRAEPANVAPRIGFTRYEQYVRDSLRYEQAAGSEKLEGEIQLRFTVDSTGQPADIEVLQGLCPACDEEAIRLLRAGPKWEVAEGALGRRTSYRIRFQKY